MVVAHVQVTHRLHLAVSNLNLAIGSEHQEEQPESPTEFCVCYGDVQSASGSSRLMLKISMSLSAIFVQCNHFASCKMGGLLKDGGKHFSGVDEVGPRIAEMLNCNALFVSGCVEAAWDQNLRRFRGLFLAVAYVKSYFLIYSFLKKYIELTVLESIH